jgi:3-dehydroquinate synthase
MPEGTNERIAVGVPTSPVADYDVRVGEGVWERLPDLLARHCPAHRFALIADDRVAALYAERLLALLEGAGMRVDLLEFPAGEASKSREVWGELSDRMLSVGMGRDSAVLALGGGVAGDLAGFVAATFMRGVPVVQLPTTLLAMIDSSVGGKTGIDTPAGKNLLGAFHPPRLVVADVATLHSLPAVELRAGLAEAIKHGAIADADYLARIERDAEAILRAGPAATVPLIAHSVRIKADVVARDERESGPRKALNFGHTIGHAVEAASRFRLLHGEAVAIGMVAEARLGERLGITETGSAERLRRALRRVGLPTEMPAEFAPEEILARTRLDKKARAGRVEYALLRRVGQAGWDDAVDDAAVLASLAP